MPKINKEKIINLIQKIPDIAAKENWVLTLDEEECSLFYSPEVIPEKAELMQITDEYAVYIDKNFNPKGLSIDYYGVNFVKHHPEFKKISKRIFGSSNKKIKTVDPKKSKKDEVLIFKKLLEGTLMLETTKKSLVHG